MSQDYQHMKTARLVELLAQTTQQHTQLLAERQFNDEYERLKETILQLQAVIATRRQQEETSYDNTSFPASM